MTAQVRVMAGPARSGKTATLLARYRQVLADEPIASALWLTPTKHSAAHIRIGLLEGGLGACFAPGVFTFEQFAQTLLAGTEAPLRFLGRMLKRQLIERLLADAKAANRLEYFGPIAETAGFVDLVAGLISDLKRQEVWPDEFGKIIQSTEPNEKNRELAGIYSEYQRLLNEHQLYDLEGRFWSARELLKTLPAENWGQFAGLTLVVVDGFADFTRTQHEILHFLATRAEQLKDLIITLPLEHESGRDDLFSKPRQTLDQLCAIHPQVDVKWQPRPASSDWPAMAHVERQLFVNPRKAVPASDTARIEIVAAAGAKAEIETIARRIKELLVRGDAASGHAVRPADVAVVFRSLESVGALVAEVFGEYGIPVAIDSPVRLDQSPLLQLLVALLRLQAGDWPFRQLLAVLANNYLQPDWREWRHDQTDGGDETTAVADAEWAVRQLQVPKGRATLLKIVRAARDAPILRDNADGDPPDEANLQRKRDELQRFGTAQRLLEKLSATLAPLDRPRTLPQWVGATQELIDELGLLKSTVSNDHEIAEPISISRYDEQAWQQLKAALAAAHQLEEEWLNIEPTPLELPRFIGRLQEIMSAERLPIETDDTGRVRVFAAQSIRALNVPYLFVAGLSEKSFPPPAREDRIYSEAECRRLNRAGLRFVEQHLRGCEEMLLFYEVMTRATRRLVLSYPALDESAQPLLPSPYLAELERACGKDRIEFTVDISLSPVPQHPHPYCPTDRRLKAVAELLDGKPQRLAASIHSLSLGGRGHSEGEKGEQAPLIAGLRAIAARSQRDDFSRFEGLLESDSAKDRLLRRFGPEHSWSVSRLENYALCPFRFFAQNVLGLEELPELSLEVDYGRRGWLAHEALAHLHRKLNEGGTPRSPTQAGAADFAKLTDETLAFCFERIQKGSQLDVALQNVDLRLIGQWLKEYLGQHEKYEKVDAALDQSLRPAHFEVSFGLKRRDDVQVDPLFTEKPFELACGSETIRFSGRIDRIDIGLVGGHVVFNVVDYKTGSKKRLKSADIDAGLALQLPLYALAVQELLMIDRRAVPWRVGYWYLRDMGFESHGLPQLFETSEGELRETENWHALRGTLLACVAALVGGIRSGRFPVFSLDEHCTSRCTYSTICRIAPIRALGKTWPPEPHFAPGQ